MKTKISDSFKTKTTLDFTSKSGAKKQYTYYSLTALEKKGFSVSRLPFSIKILLENLLRHEDGISVSSSDIENLARWDSKKKSEKEIAFSPARVLLQDFTGVPTVCDLAAMRDALAKLGGDAKKINPLIPCELVIDHSVQVDSSGNVQSFAINVEKEFERNQERYVFLRWGQTALKNFKVVPPGTGIVHQINLEYLARVVFEHKVDSETCLYPDTLVGTDSHTTMINGLGVLGWGVGGIEAEAAMLGQPTNFLIPQVVGVKLHGALQPGVTATDLVLTITQLLRKKGVVGKFVEFYGKGLSFLSLADRATLANMAPEYGATCGIFPIDQETLNYLRLSSRPEDKIELIETYAKAQGLFRTDESSDPEFSDTLELDLAQVESSIAGPKRPQDRVPLKKSKELFLESIRALVTSPKSDKSVNGELAKLVGEGGEAGNGDKLAEEEFNAKLNQTVPVEIDGKTEKLCHGSVVIAAITSCTNTSNPSVMVGAGLLAKKAIARGLTSKSWVKTSLAPGSKVVTDYLKDSGLLDSLNKLHFNLVGYGCTTCIGNSGPLPEEISQAINDGNLVAAAVLSGNRNFEGRVNPDVRANYLASPPLVVAYALKGHMNWDPYSEPIGQDQKGQDVFLKDIWPSVAEINEVLNKNVKPEMFEAQYAHVFEGDDRWKTLEVPKGDRFQWAPKSTYIRQPSFFDNLSKQPSALKDISQARVLAVLGDSVTTDHISPAGNISKTSPAARYLIENGVKPIDFNSYGARRGNHEVMVRGTFANIRLKNLLLPGTEGGVTRFLPTGEQMSIFDASVLYQKQSIPLLILAGKEYGSGSSRDWAAKGPKMLGIQAVIAESYERIHRSNLIGMGILPLQFEEGVTREKLGLTGEEVYTILGIASDLAPGKVLNVQAKPLNGSVKEFKVVTRIDTPVELAYYQHGGILQYVLRQMME